MQGTDLTLLRIFATVVEAGGLSPAQAQLNLALSTISGRISDLEMRLGYKLCRRGRTGFSLTTEGAAVYEEALKLFVSIDGFDRRVGRLGSTLAGSLSLGITDNTLTDRSSRIDAVIAQFCDTFPKVTLTLLTRPPNELIRDVVAGTLEVAIASFPRQALGLAYEDLYTERHGFFCGAGHPLFDRPDTEIDVGVVREHALVGRAYWGSRDLKSFAISAPKALVSDMEAAARLILSGRFLGYLPAHFAAGFVVVGRLREIGADRFGYVAPFQVAYNPQLAHRPILSGIVEAVRAQMRSGVTEGHR